MIMVYITVIVASFQSQSQQRFAPPSYNSLSFLRTKIKDVYDSNHFNVAIEVKDQRRLIKTRNRTTDVCTL